MSNIATENEIKLSPLKELFISMGYQPDGENGKSVFNKFSTVEDEIHSLYHGVGLRDISHTGVIEIKGKDVMDFLNRITTNNLKDLKKEQLKKTIFTSDKGRIIDLTTVINFDDYQLLICNKENKKKVISWIDKYVIVDDVKHNDVEGKYVITEILGPQADSFMHMICGNIVGEIPLNGFKVVDAEGILFFLMKLPDRNDNTKFWVFADHENGQKLVNYMIENTVVFDFNLIGNEAYESYRIEQGIPVAPNELNDNYNPHEAKLIEFVDFEKGCYIGQEVIARLDTYDKVKQYLMGIVFESEVDPEKELNLFDKDGSESGKLTSVIYSKKCKKFVGLGYVKRAYAKNGANLIAKNDTSEVNVEIRNLPLKK